LIVDPTTVKHVQFIQVFGLHRFKLHRHLVEQTDPALAMYIVVVQFVIAFRLLDWEIYSFVYFYIFLGNPIMENLQINIKL
jgi:hypothetical protein